MGIWHMLVLFLHCLVATPKFYKSNSSASKAGVDWIALAQKSKIDLGKLVGENFGAIFNECVNDGSPAAIKSDCRYCIYPTRSY